MNFFVRFLDWWFRLLIPGLRNTKLMMQFDRSRGYSPPALELDHVNLKPARMQPRVPQGLQMLGWLLFWGATAIAFAFWGGTGWLIMQLALVIFIISMIAIGWGGLRREPIVNNPPLNYSAGQAVYDIRVPHDLKWKPHDAYQFVRQLLIDSGGVTFQIIADYESVTWRIVDHRGRLKSDTIITAIQAMYPDAKVKPSIVEQSADLAPVYRYIQKYSLGMFFPAPLPIISDLKSFDPLISMAQAMNTLQQNECMTYTIFVAGFAKSASEVGVELIETELDTEYSSKFLNEMKRKLANPLFNVLAMVEVETPYPERLDILVSTTNRVMQYEKSELNYLVSEDIDDTMTTSKLRGSQTTFQLLNRYLTNDIEAWREHLLVLEPQEIASLWHLPYDDFTAPKIRWVDEELAPLPSEMKDNPMDGILLGYGVADEQQYPAHILPEDRATHMIITGEIGMGKSTLMHNLVRQDIERGNGVAVIDPKGNLVQAILQSDVLAGREQDIILWDLADTACPPPFNFLLQASGTPREDAAATIMAVFAKVYGDDFAYAKMGQTMVNALLAIMGAKTPTLRDVSKLYRDPDFRHEMTAKLDNPATEEFWARFETTTQKSQQDQFDPVLRRLELLYGDKVLYPIFCQPKMLNIRELMEQKKILLVALNSPSGYNLTRDKLDLLGSLLVSEFQLAVSSVDLPEPFYLYVDEAHRFVTSSLDQIFIMARERQLSFTLATQYPKQLPTQMFDAVMETVGAMVAFQSGADTARILQKRMEPEFTAQDLINLEVHDAAVRMRYRGKQMRPFLLKTIAVPEPDDLDKAAARAKALRTKSIEQNDFLCGDEIRAWQKELYPRNVPSAEDNSGKDNLADDDDEFWEPDEDAPDNDD